MPMSQRLVDTRQTAPLGPGGTLSVSVTGAAPLPAPGTVTAAVLNLTVVAPFGPGFWTVWPHTSARPEASNLNIDELQSLAGGAVPNLVTVPVGADGVVDVYGSAGGNVIVDLLGYYTAADTADGGSIPGTVRPDTRARHAPGGDVRAGRDTSVHDPRRRRRQRRGGQPHLGHQRARLLAGVPAGRCRSGDVEPELAPRLLRRRGQPGDRDGRPVRHGQHLLRTGWRPAHRPRRYVHGCGCAIVDGGPVRADDRTDAHRGHAGARAQPARRDEPPRTQLHLRGAARRKPCDRTARRCAQSCSTPPAQAP